MNVAGARRGEWQKNDRALGQWAALAALRLGQRVIDDGVMRDDAHLAQTQWVARHNEARGSVVEVDGGDRGLEGVTQSGQ